MTSEENLDPNVDSGPTRDGLESTISMEPGETSGTVIGHYHLLHRIGVGGMGEVWQAEQKEPVRRRVALKVVKAGMNTRDVIARFESERQMLALMDHPAIAKVFDAGTTPLGAPYFVMEYVAGVPITDYCDKHRLDTRERLQLFVHVCEGVQHAHQKAIIHRDLKPSNILVSEVDGRAMPKIIDFGVAKALTQKLSADTMFTRAGAVLGTPEYMSPEQANSSGEDIDTRTDVYSLGIIFYELLAGAPPIELRNLAFDELIRRLREDDAPKPSTKIRTQQQTKSTDVANKRRTEPETLVRLMRGDLDSIALKALEKDRSRRYGSPSDLAADIGRFLRNEPVEAVPPSAAYRARKFAHRYRGALITVCAFVLVLIAAAGVSVWQGVRATKQRDRADAETAVAKAVNQFLQEDLLSQASTDSQGGDTKPDPDVKVRTLLDRAAAQVGKRFPNQPLVEAGLRQTIGNTYRNLGLYPQAEEHLRKAYELNRDHRGADDVGMIEALENLSTVVSDQGRNAEALALAKNAFELRTRKLGPEDPTTVVSMQNLGVDYLLDQKFGEAEPLLKKALELQNRRLGYDNVATLNTSDSLATVYIFESRYAEADALLTKGLESYRRLYGPDHPYTQREMYGLGRVLVGEGKFPEAETQVTQVLARLQQLKGAQHPDTLNVQSMLGQIYVGEGKFGQAVALLQKTVQDFRTTLGPAHLRTLSAEQELGNAYDSEGDLPRAAQVWQGALQGFRGQGGDGEVPAANVSELLAQNLTKQHKCDQAEPLLRQALAVREKTGPDKWQRFRAQAFLGAALSGQKKYAEAEPLLLSGYDGMSTRAAQMPALQKKWIRLAGEQIAELYSGWGKPEKAAEWRAKVQKL